MKPSLLLSFALLLLSPSLSWANDSLYRPGILLAQADADDSYDPFSDYSEFDEASDEEADINFFRNGRFFTVGFTGGMRSYTDNMAKIYSSSVTYGLFFAYFFDLRFAIQLGFMTGDSPFEINAPPAGSLSGNVSFTFLQMALKYYFNTQNVTRGLADLNPYFIGGFSQVYRTYTLSNNTSDLSRDSTIGLDIGAGLEIPMMRKKAYFGIQAMYHMINFKDENSYVLINSAPTNAKVAGDSFDILGIIGVNF